MKRRLYSFLLCTIALTGAHDMKAQCPAGRFIDTIFSSITIDSNITYSTNITYSIADTQQMDIYQPTGDTMRARPLIILAHEGAFVEGDKETDPSVTPLCVNFAKRGYVTASINYRLGNPLSMISDSTYAINEVVQAFSDGKAAIRFFTKDAATTNTYKIDTNNIFIGGNSAGAVLYMHVAYITSVSSCTPDIIPIIDSNGGFEGNSGNAGYPAKFKAVIDLAGGLNSPIYVQPGGLPSVNAQGTLDNVVPYTCADAIGGSIKVTLCGLGTLEPIFTSSGIYHSSLIFPGAAHVPWNSSTADFYSVDSLITHFLYTLVCNTESVTEVKTQPELSMFPNPTSDFVDIQSSGILQSISIYDETGRAIQQINAINNNHYQVNTLQLRKGLYFAAIKFNDVNYIPVVKKIIVE